MSQETESHGTLTLVRERPTPTLAEHAARIEKLMKKPLPEDVAGEVDKIKDAYDAPVVANDQLGAGTSLG